MKNHKEYEHLQKSREAIKVINKRLFPITDLPLLDKFLIDCMLKRRRLSETFPEWSSVNRLPLGIIALSLYVCTLCLSASYNSIIFIGIVSVLLIMGYRAKWLMDRLHVLGNHKATKRAILLAASGLLSVKGFNRDYDEDFLKPALVNYLKGAETDALKFINLYVELVYALTPTAKEIKYLKEEFDDLIQTSRLVAQSDTENSSQYFSKKDAVEFINKDLSISINEKFAKEDQQIEDSLAILINRSELEESVSDEAEDESDVFARLLTDKEYFDEKYSNFKISEKKQQKAPGVFDNDDMNKAMMELIKKEQSEQKEHKKTNKEHRVIRTSKEEREDEESSYKTPPKAIIKEEKNEVAQAAIGTGTAAASVAIVAELLPEIIDILPADHPTAQAMDDEEKARIADIIGLGDEIMDDSPLPHQATVDHESEMKELLQGLEGDLPDDSELPGDIFSSAHLDSDDYPDDDYDKDLHNQDAYQDEGIIKFDFENVDQIESDLFASNLRTAIDDDE
ncbi:hypothetical protein [Aeromonas veronii]|uniref:Uncharacterized protein n=1 Tax=Aeromonas veronii TaxID=654 RepID=A0A2T4MZJ3_AERVE|nr:hypothetical protein [Aeromonas veronii]PTH80009.1 hypothetical protein DAA48_15710 [Aeromonas veronii]